MSDHAPENNLPADPDDEVPEPLEIDIGDDEDAAAEPAAEGEGVTPPPAPEPPDAAQVLRMVEAILFAAAEPVSEKSLQARLPEGADVPAMLAELQAHYSHRGVNLVAAGNTWAMRTAPDLGPLLARQAEVVRKLSRAAVETMAIIAYHQPVTRAEIEEIRGVAISKGTMDNLLEAGWIRPRGRRRTPGRPVTWGTTDAFLHHFDLESLDDLPGISDLKAAGLLDAGPALQAYRETGVTSAPNEGDNDDGAGDEAELVLPLDPELEDGEDEDREP